MQYLSLPDKLAACFGYDLDGRRRVDAMLVEEIDDIRLETAQGGFCHGTDRLRPAVHARSDLTVLEAELGGDHHLVAEGCQRLAEQFFVVAGAVGFGGIKESDTQLECAADQFDGGATLGGRTVAVAQAHAAQTDGGNFQPAFTKCSFLHDVSFH